MIICIVQFFKSKIELLNPGGLLGNLTINEIIEKRISKRRNKDIARLLDEMGYMEGSGRGMESIQK